MVYLLYSFRKTSLFLQSEIGWLFGNPVLPFTADYPVGCNEANRAAFSPIVNSINSSWRLQIKTPKSNRIIEFVVLKKTVFLEIASSSHWNYQEQQTSPICSHCLSLHGILSSHFCKLQTNHFTWFATQFSRKQSIAPGMQESHYAQKDIHERVSHKKSCE